MDGTHFSSTQKQKTHSQVPQFWYVKSWHEKGLQQFREKMSKLWQMIARTCVSGDFKLYNGVTEMMHFNVAFFQFMQILLTEKCIKFDLHEKYCMVFFSRELKGFLDRCLNINCSVFLIIDICT